MDTCDGVAGLQQHRLSESETSTLRRSIRSGAPGAFVMVTPSAKSATNQPPMPSSRPARDAVSVALKSKGASVTVCRSMHSAGDRRPQQVFRARGESDGRC